MFGKAIQDGSDNKSNKETATHDCQAVEDVVKRNVSKTEHNSDDFKSVANKTRRMSTIILI